MKQPVSLELKCEGHCSYGEFKVHSGSQWGRWLTFSTSSFWKAISRASKNSSSFRALWGPSWWEKRGGEGEGEGEGKGGEREEEGRKEERVKEGKGETWKRKGEGGWWWDNFLSHIHLLKLTTVIRRHRSFKINHSTYNWGQCWTLYR